MSSARTPTSPEPFCERAYDDWLAQYYDTWYPPTDETYRLLTQLLETFPELEGKSRAELDIWDCACGTGATFIPLTKAGYRPWGSDASVAMLQKAREKCELMAVSTDRLFALSWNDTNGCRAAFQSHGQRFDVIFALNNSLCHMPKGTGYLDIALKNFFDFLKPRGRLIVDTKRYLQTPALRGACMYNELRWLDENWIVRETRCDERIIDGASANFHTSVVYDVDPVFQCCRATILTTIEGLGMPRTHALHYYPLPAHELADQLTDAGFASQFYAARTSSLQWGYDCFVAQRPFG